MYVCFSADPFFIFSECYFYILASDENHFSDLSSTVQHFGGTVYFDFNDSITHIILSTKDQALAFHPLSHTASHVQVLSEDEIWRCVSNHTPLPLSKQHRSHPLRIPAVLYRSVASSPLFAGFLFLLYLPHP